MDVVFGLIPMMLFFGFLVVVVFIWMAKSGQFDDLDGAANSIFMEDDYDDEKDSKAQQKIADNSSKKSTSVDEEQEVASDKDKSVS